MLRRLPLLLIHETETEEAKDGDALVYLLDAFYEHLRRGSVRVQVGQRVKTGQVIAQVGWSGINSSPPHLHFHVADGPDALYSNGRTYGLAAYARAGALPGHGERRGRQAVARCCAHRPHSLHASAQQRRAVCSAGTLARADLRGSQTAVSDYAANSSLC